jgi:micrococcal nuclease
VRRSITLLTAATGLVGCGSAERAAPSTTIVRQPNATVEYVVDGDTVDLIVDGQEVRARLIGIDTPETKKQNTPVECFGPEATAYTESLLPVGTPVFIERDVVARDDYGRLLVYLHRPDNGVFVNLDIVAKGYAQPLTIPPNVMYSDDFVDAARSAEAADLGLWGGCGG